MAFKLQSSVLGSCQTPAETFLALSPALSCSLTAFLPESSFTGTQSPTSALFQGTPPKGISLWQVLMAG